MLAQNSAFRAVNSKAADVNAKMMKLIEGATLQQLIDLKSQGATFGALSDAELNAIKSSITALKPDVSSEFWNAELDRFIAQMKRGLPTGQPKATTADGTRLSASERARQLRESRNQ